MFKRKQNNIKYEFFPRNKEVLYDSLVTPISETIIPWRKGAVHSDKESKNLDRINGRTDICSGISLQNKIGWLVRSWTDMEIQLDHNTGLINVHFPSKEMENMGFNPVGFFPSHLFTNFVKVPDGTFPTLLKINTPWRFKCPKGWGIMHSPLHYHNQTDYYSSTGILDPRHINELNPVMFINTKKDKFLIRHGDPLFQITPICLTQPDYVCRPMSEKESGWEYMVNHVFRTRFRPAKKAFTDLNSLYFSSKQ